MTIRGPYAHVGVSAAFVILASCRYLEGKVPDFGASGKWLLAEIGRCAQPESEAGPYVNTNST